MPLVPCEIRNGSYSCVLPSGHTGPHAATTHVEDVTAAKREGVIKGLRWAGGVPNLPYEFIAVIRAELERLRAEQKEG